MDFYRKIERSVTISADKRSTVDLQVDIWSQDLNVTKFVLKLDTADSTPIDLTNAAVRVAIVYNQDGQDVKIEAAGIVEDVATQKIAYVMSDKLAGFEGEVTAGFYVMLKTGQRIDVQNVTFNMCKSLLDKDLEAATENYYQTFDDIAKDVRNQVDTQKSAMLAKTNEVTSYGDTQKTAMNNIVKDVQSTGNTAKKQIGQVLPDVQSKVSAINTELAKIDENMPDLFVAYANSADGKVDFTKIKPKENLLVLENKIVGKYASRIGDLIENKNYTASDYISVEGLKKYQLYFENNITVSGETGQHWLGYVFYDNNKNYIDNSYVSLYWNDVYSGITRTNITVNAPTNAAYIIISWVSTYDYKIKFEESETPTTYLPSPTDNYRNSFVKYIGYGVKNSTSPNDYKWQINPEWQKAQVDDLQIGGRNLIKNTSKEIKNMTQDIWSFVASNNNTVNFNILEYLGNTLTFRVWIENPTDVCRIQIWIKDKMLKTGNYIQAGQSGYSQFTVDVPKDGITQWNISIGNDKVGTQLRYGYKKLKCEAGDIPTDWTPAPEDVPLLSSPINSILTTLSAENPSTTLGGTWTQLGTESKFGSTIYYWKRTN